VLSEQRKLNLRLLLAEDNLINQKVAVTVLQKAGYSVDAVETGLEAVSKAKAHLYNAILMDVQMPGMDGFEATQQIRDWEKDRSIHIPIIAMTAHAMQGDRERCLAAGMDDYITKPLQPRVLFSALSRWIQPDTTDAQNEVQDYSSQTEVGTMDFDDGLFGESALSAQSEPDSVLQTISFTNILPVDFESALPHFGDDRDFMMQMYKEYKVHLQEHIAEIQSALQAQDANRLARLAHNLKGTSLNFSAGPLASLALSLEEIGKREELTDAPRLVAQLAVETQRVLVYLSDKEL
jgi:CheY-like chemotaxis protein